MPLHLATIFFIAVAVAYLVALAFFPALAWSRRRRRTLLILATAFVSVTPLVIPATAPFLRLLAAMNAIALMVKFYDLHVTCGPDLHPGFPAYATYLPNWLSIVWRKLRATPRPTQGENARRFGLALVQSAVAVALVVWTMQRNWRSDPFLVEHAVKAFSFFLALVPITHAYTALWRGSGGRGLDPMDRPLFAATPAEFWRSYNRPAQQFFYEYIYRRISVPPIRAIIITFAVSAIVHEYVFGIALGRVQGYQTSFFLLQGIAAAVTFRARPSGRGIVPAIAATFLFNLVSSVFFFARVHVDIPIYANGLPGWLDW